MRHHEMFRSVAINVSNPPFSQIRRLFRSPLGLAYLLSLTALAPMSARADDQIRAVRLSNVVGTVQILSGTETQFSQAYPNMPLTQGSTIKTGEDGRTEIQFEDGSVARLTPNTSVALSTLGRSSDGSTKTDIELLTGLSYIEMSGTANQRFAVHFGGNDVISPAPAKFRVNLDANPVELAMLDGSAHLSNGAAYSVDVKSGETVRFDANDGSRYFLAEGVDGDSWDQWNADRDRAMSQMAAQQTREARGSINPNDPGWSDLDYYGNWYSLPGNGSFWSPSGMGTGWDPYGSGYWGYYGTGGYTWISGYPWGWLPYRCGTWNYYNAFGWGWSPGVCTPSLYPIQSIGYSPSNYRRLPRPTHPVHPLPRGSQGIVPPKAWIAVDRGPQATEITPRTGTALRMVAINGETARLLPKTPNPVNSFANSSGNASNVRLAGDFRPLSASSGRSDYGGQRLGSVPVYRPAAPNAGYRPSATSSFASHSSGASASSSSFHAPSVSSSVSSSHMSSPAPSTGGGHPK